MLDFIKVNAIAAFAIAGILTCEGQPTVGGTIAALATVFVAAFAIITLARLAKLAWDNARGC